MTLNNIINRIKTIALAHKQVRNFKKGLVSDFLTDKTTKYPSVFLQDNGGNISRTNGAATFSYRMFFMDLVHVSEDTKDNEQDVHSDMVSIAIDIIAQISSPEYNDWKINADNSLQLVVEDDGDMFAGCIIDFSISIMFKQDRCMIPSDLIIDTTDNEMKIVYDEKYTADGTEGSTLTIPILAGKKVLFVTRESVVLYKVSSSPDSVEYTWNDTVITLGLPVQFAGERFLILYRNY